MNLAFNIMELDFIQNIFEIIGNYIPKFIGFLIAVVVIQIFFRFFLKVYKTFLNKRLENDESRVDTYYFIIRDAVRYILYIIYIILFLQSLGVSPTLLITSVGAISVIIGIAGQQIIMDVFNGFFVLFDKYYRIGDYIKTEDYEGYVEDFKIRSTFLRTFNNEIIIIPNSNITNIINYSKLNSFVYQNVPAAYNYDIEIIEQELIPKLIEKVQSYDEVLSIEYLGVDSLKPNHVELKMLLYSNPENRFISKRILLKEYKIISDRLGFKIPVNNLIVEE